MSEIPISSPSDDEFATFLNEAAQTKTFEFDQKAYLEDLNNRIVVSLNEVGYQALFEDNERTIEVSVKIADELAERGIYMDTASTIHNVLMIISQNEAYAIELIRIHTMITETNDMDRVFDSDQVISAKAELLAELEIVRGIESSDPLMHAANLIAPGGPIDHDDPMMESYRITAIEKLANEKHKNEENKKLLDDVLDFAGVDNIDVNPGNVELVRSIAIIVVTGRVLTTSEAPNAKANRAEKLTIMVSEFHIPAHIAAKIIEFIEIRFPL
ncbi:MAG: hypothetical protein WAW80_01490 [Candidatus Saccharimonadales bacterium]